MPGPKGRPRLVFTVGSADWNGEPAREFTLDEEVTVIGSGDRAALQLDGIDAQAARIVHEEDDEYVLYVLGDVSHGVDGDPHDRVAHREVLRTGARIAIGEWSMSFQRDEAADHPLGAEVRDAVPPAP